MQNYENFCYIDFDEVFSVYWANGFDGYTQLKSGLYYSPVVVDAFLKMATAHHLTIAWVTTWEDGVHSVAERMGFKDTRSYTVLPAFENDTDLDSWLKFDSVSYHYDHHRPQNAIWLDDDIYSYPFAVKWCGENDVRWLSPNKATGLTLSDIRLLDNWFVSR